MKKILLGIALLVAAVAGHAQTTVVSAQILDPASNPYRNAVVTVDFINNSSLIAKWNNFPLTVTTWTTSADSNGNFSQALPDLNFIAPATGTFYNFRICANTLVPPGQPTNPCFTYASPACPNVGCITGATITITAAIQAVSIAVPNSLLTNVVTNPNASQTITGQKLTLTPTAPFVVAQANTVCFADGVNATFAQAITCAGSSGTIELPPSAGTLVIASNTTIPAGVTLKVDQGALLSPSTGVTLTVNGPVIAGHYQIAATGYLGTITLNNVPVYYAEWAPGANGCRQILATWSLMPSNGTRGIVDGRAYPSLNQACDINPFPAAAPGGKLLLGNQTWQTTATWSMVQGQSVEGMGWGSPNFGLTLIQAVSGFPTTGVPVLQTSNDSTNNQHIMHLGIDCAGISNATGIFVRDSQENTRVEDVAITGCPVSGLTIGTGVAGAAQNSGTFREIFVTNGGAGPSCPSTMLGIFVNVSSQSFRGIKDVTIDMRGCSTTHPNVDMQINTVGSYQDIHLEGSTTGMQIASQAFTSNVSCQLSGSTVVDCIKLVAGSVGSEINGTICACTSNVINDTVLSIAFSAASYGQFVPHYTAMNTTNATGPDLLGWLALPELSAIPIGSANNVDSCFASANFHGRVCSDNNSTFTPMGTRAVLTADWTCGTGGTVSSCAAATIIGSGAVVALSFNLGPVGLNLQLDCDGVVSQATAVTLNQWNLITSGVGATNVTAIYDMYTAATAKAGGAVTDQGSTTTTFQISPSWTLGAAGTKMPFHIHADIQGSASGTGLSVQLLAPTPADLVTIYRGSGCWIHP